MQEKKLKFQTHLLLTLEGIFEDNEGFVDGSKKLSNKDLYF